MNIMNSINPEQFMAGIPIKVFDNQSKELCKVYPVTLREIAEVGAKNFYSYLNVFTLNKEDIDEYFSQQAEIDGDFTPFQFLLVLTQVDPQYLVTAQMAFKMFLHEDSVSFLAQNEAIVLGDIKEERVINNELFEQIRTYVQAANLLDTQSAEAKMDNPSDAKAAQIIKKLKEGRKAREKAKSGSELTFSDLVASLAAGGNGLNILNIWDLTYYAFNDQFKRMQMREEYENSYRSILAGADPKKVKLKYWISNIQDKDK